MSGDERPKEALGMSGHRGAKDKRHRRNGNPRSQKLLQKVWKAKGMKGHRARAHKAKRDVRPQGRQEQPAQKGKRSVLTSEGHQTMFWGTGQGRNIASNFNLFLSLARSLFSLLIPLHPRLNVGSAVSIFLANSVADQKRSDSSAFNIESGVRGIGSK